MRTAPLGAVAEINPRGEKVRAGEKVSFVGMADLDAQAALATPVTTRTFAEVAKGYTVFRDRDLLVAKITPCWENGKIGEAVLGRRVGVGSTEFHVVRPRPDLDSRYALHLLRHPYVRAAGELRMTGSGGQRRVPANFLQTLQVPLLPLDEQRRIAAILDHADALRAKHRQVLAHLDTLTQSIFHYMFGEPRTWPDWWPMGVIGDMAESVQYGTSARASDTGEWPILRMGNVTDLGRLDLRDLKYIDLSEAETAKFTTERGDMLFNRTNSKEKVGKTAVVRTDRPLAVAGYLVRVRFKAEHRADFVSAYMTSRHGLAVRQKLAKAAVNQANINATEMRSIPIALPPTRLQVEFSDRLVPRI